MALASDWNGRIFHSFGDEKTKRIVIGTDYRLSELKDIGHSY